MTAVENANLHRAFMQHRECQQLKTLLGDELLKVDSIDEIAKVYARAIVSVLPEMACTLAGWSFGGVLARVLLGY
ncbi:thioesterase domain-containing protein [Bradyrhizobium hipponense]|uniref:thioesterase domain-containing protein n=1 Tax=Bradyrhizobium hipponense TaxID=2605638 RepID=UPI00165308E6|nr:thioesterase domain-containing protein [Bradyrhizobium hipponense]